MSFLRPFLCRLQFHLQSSTFPPNFLFKLSVALEFVCFQIDFKESSNQSFFQGVFKPIILPRSLQTDHSSEQSSNRSFFRAVFKPIILPRSLQTDHSSEQSSNRSFFQRVFKPIILPRSLQTDHSSEQSSNRSFFRGVFKPIILPRVLFKLIDYFGGLFSNC